MEWSALVYVVLAAAVVALGLCVENKEYVQAAVEGGRAFGCRPTERRQARNRIAAIGIYCLLTGVSACRIAVGNDYWVYRDRTRAACGIGIWLQLYCEMAAGAFWL